MIDDEPIVTGRVLYARPDGAELRRFYIANGIIRTRSDVPRDVDTDKPCLRLEPDVKTAAEAIGRRAAR